MAIEHSGISITTDAIKTKLLDMEHDVGVGKAGSAFASKFQNRNGRAGNTGRSNGSDSFNLGANNVKKQVRCFGCKQPGHYMNKCPNRNVTRQNACEKTTNAFSVVFLNGKFNKHDGM